MDELKVGITGIIGSLLSFTFSPDDLTMWVGVACQALITITTTIVLCRNKLNGKENKENKENKSDKNGGKKDDM